MRIRQLEEQNREIGQNNDNRGGGSDWIGDKVVKFKVRRGILI